MKGFLHYGRNDKLGCVGTRKPRGVDPPRGVAARGRVNGGTAAYCREADAVVG